MRTQLESLPTKTRNAITGAMALGLSEEALTAEDVKCWDDVGYTGDRSQEIVDYLRNRPGGEADAHAAWNAIKHFNDYQVAARNLGLPPEEVTDPTLSTTALEAEPENEERPGQALEYLRSRPEGFSVIDAWNAIKGLTATQIEAMRRGRLSREAVTSLGDDFKELWGDEKTAVLTYLFTPSFWQAGTTTLTQAWQYAQTIDSFTSLIPRDDGRMAARGGSPAPDAVPSAPPPTNHVRGRAEEDGRATSPNLREYKRRG